MECIAHINDKSEIQTVKEHSENVSQYAFSEANDIGLSSVLKLVSLLHDMGKNKEEFQNYLKSAIDNEKGVKKGSVNHSTAGARYFYELIKNNGLYKDKIDILLVELICYAIMTHHGLIDCIDDKGEDKYTKKLYSENERSFEEVINNSKIYISDDLILELYKNAKVEIENVYNKIKGTTENMKNITEQKGVLFDNNPAYFMLGNLQRLICSFLIDADRRDTHEFMDSCKEERIDRDDLEELWIQYQNKLDERINEFSVKNDIDKYRRQISDDCYEFAKSCGNGIYKLDVPTGGGKTLSSMRFALEFAKQNNKKHIYYIAPYISILEQNANEYKKIFDDDKNILEHHSNVIIDDEKDEEILKKQELLEDNWSSPIILTTMLRFLEVLFDSNTTNIRRFNQLANSVIILDEAQQIPVKCVYMFNTMMNFLSKVCNTTIVFCTATQPLFGDVKYPLLFDIDCDIIKNNTEMNYAFKRNIITYDRSTDSGKYDKQALTDLVNRQIDNVNSILVILNTKSAVKDLFEELRNVFNDDVDILQLTTYMCPKHRLDVIENIKNKLKNGNDKKTICISTQLIEAGVDISFDMVIRSLTGIDGIMQAAGRCNRNGEKEVSAVFIIDYLDENTRTLQDINEAKRAANEVLFTCDKHIEITKNNVDEYYTQYFFNREDKMKYKIDDKENIYNLLSDNRGNNKEYIRKNSQNDVEYFMRQAYKTAGSEFKVIDQNTISVIARYGDANTLIEEYKREYSISGKNKILKKLQCYTMSLFRNDKLLKEIIDRRGISSLDDDKSILVVDNDYYDENGITAEFPIECF